MECSSTLVCQKGHDASRLLAPSLSMPSSGTAKYKMARREPLLRAERRTHFDSADYYMQREGKPISGVLPLCDPSSQPASPLLERPASLVTSLSSRLSCNT